MYRATFELEAITPVFMRGADQGKAEFRPASVKGVMRWWFRALAGAYLGNDIEKLREVEGRIFGSAGGGKSRAMVSAEALSKPTPLINVESVKVVPNGRGTKLNVRFDFPYDKASYLFFSVKMGLESFLKDELNAVLKKHGIRNKFTDERQLKQVIERRGVTYGGIARELREEIRGRIPSHYPPGSRFRGTICSRERNAFLVAVTSLWLAVTYGGFGFRARRGAGSLRVVGITWDVPSEDRELKQFLETLKNATLPDLGRILEDETLKDAINKEFGKANCGPSPHVPSSPTLSEIVVLISEKSYRTHSDALRALQEAYAGHYNRSRRMYEGGVRFDFANRRFSHRAIQHLSGGRTNNEYRYYFGTPVIYANWKVEVRGIGNEHGKEKEYSRRASSLILTVKEIMGGYHPIAVVLPYQYLPNHRGEFAAKSKSGGARIQVIASGNSEFTNGDFVKWLTADVVNAFKKRGFVEVYP